MCKLGHKITIWAALLLFPLSGFALGLGEIEVDSFLNQPLKAEIEVVSARPGEIDDLLVSLASRQAFNKAGLERPAHLSKLRFTVDKSEDGQSAKILITTKTAVKEPFLNFLIEADWAKGRLLREFTVLLDPPYFAQQAAAEQAPVEPIEPVAAVESPVTTEPEPMPAPIVETTEPADMEPEPMAPIAEMEDESVAEAEPVEVDEPVSEPIALAQEPTEDETFEPMVSDIGYAGDDIIIEKGDTLWSIASQFQDGEHSMSQIMLALQATNPDAFGQNNINNLRVGAVLRAPDMDALDSLSEQEAYAQVLEQNGLWDDYVARVSGETMVGSPMATEEGAAEEQEPDNRLSLLAPGEGDSTSASMQQDADGEAEAGQLRKQLALAEEELEASRLENDDLKSRIEALEEQIGKYEELQKLVQIEDDSLAQLQEQAAEPAVEETSPEQLPVEETPLVDEPEPVAEQQPEPTDELMAEAPIEPEQAPEEAPATAEEGFIEDAEPTVDEGETAMVDDQMGDAAEQELMEQEQAEDAPAPAPVIVTETPQTAKDGGILDMLPSIDQILADPIILGGLGGIIIALLLALFFLKRRQQTSDEKKNQGITLEEPEQGAEDITPVKLPEQEESTPQVEEVEPDDIGVLEEEENLEELLPEQEEEDEMAKTAIISAAEMPEPEAPAAAAEEQDDVLNEVDVYLAYGLYDNAEQLLTDSIASHPDRAEYRAKLLDTHFATKNKDSFVKQAEALKALGPAADRYWDRVQIMGFELAPDNALFAGAKDSDLSVADLEYSKPETADFDLGSDDDITDFSADDFDLSDESTFEEIPVVADTEAEPQLDDELELPAAESEQVEAADEDIFDLGDELPDELGDLDMSIDEDSIEQPVGDEPSAEQADSLEFDLPDDLEETREIGAEVLDEQTSELDMMSEDTTNFKIGDAGAAQQDAAGETAEEDITDFEIGEQDDGELDLGELEASVDESDIDTEMMTPVHPEEGTMHIDAGLDMDMAHLEDAELETGSFNPLDTDADLNIPEDDLPTTEFKPVDFESTEVMPELSEDDDIALEDVEVELEMDEEIASADQAEKIDKTGTFAPGDFDDEQEAASEDKDADIEGLMLPDDVDEVSTKLDLARAFIDMGDAEGAKSSLQEVLEEGDDEQKSEATALLSQIS